MMFQVEAAGWLLAQGGGASDYSFVGVMVIIGVMFYMLIIRPEQRKRKEQEQDIRSVKKNDRVVTVGGIFGTVVNTNQEDKVVIRVDDNLNAKLQISRTAIARVIRDEKAASKDDAQD